MKKQPREYSVELERDGVLYSGTYTIERGLITVTYEFIPNTTQLGNQVLAHEALAKVLLGEILDVLAARKVPRMER
ncbi:hypothetical protein SAMN05216308_10797 [Nitrosospira sp. Nsp13]|nr:hypothetical protein SAMN05216308_10797 [Nitrosospira sp. Nsp13]